MLMHVAKLYLQSYYQAAAAAYGGLQGAEQYNAVFGATAAAGLTMAPNNPTAAVVYPYFQYGPASAGAAAAGYSMAQYPQLYQYAAAAAVGATTAVAGGGIQQYGGSVVALSPNSVGQAGIVDLCSPFLLAIHVFAVTLLA
jgi:hypothetical protein